VTRALLAASSLTAIVSLAQWIAVYTWLEPWWRRSNQIGHSLVLLALFAMVTPALFLLSLLFDLSRAASQALAWAEIALLFSYAPAMGWRSVVWIRTARRETTRQKGQNP
jgi:hypothetical protein